MIPVLLLIWRIKMNIKQLQKRLADWGCLPYDQVDGYIGPITNAAIILFKQKRGLDPTAEVTDKLVSELGLPSDFLKESVISEKFEKGISLIQKFEGLRLNVYPDPLTGGKPYTVGYGCTRKLDGSSWRMGERITKAEALDLLYAQVEHEFLPSLVKIPYWDEMNDNQRSGLLSFAWNVGAAFYNGKGFGTISRRLKNKDWQNVPQALMLYVNPGTNVERGLRTRRQEEGRVFASKN